MAIKYGGKQSFLGRYKNQELRWLVKGHFAAAYRVVGDDTRFEVFEAKPNDKAVCGYAFTFLYEFPTIENMQKVLPKVVTDTRDMTAKKWDKLLGTIQSFENERFLTTPCIDTTFYIPSPSW